MADELNHDLSREDFEAIRASIMPQDGWGGDDWDYAMAEAAINFWNRRAAPSAEASAQAEELPPLPERGAAGETRINGEAHQRYTADQMLTHREEYARAAIAADRANRAAEAQGEGLTELAALKERVELVHRLCCGTAPKQSVGELIAVTLKMPEWDTIAAHLRAAGRAALSDDAIFAAMKPHMLMADGGYVCDTASEHVIAAGKALLRAACVSAAGQGGDGEDAKDAKRWRAFRNRDGFDDLDFDRFRDQFREDADAIVDAAITATKGEKGGA